MQTAFGWVAGFSVGALASYGVFLALSQRYLGVYTSTPASETVGTFVLSVAGAFGGMWVADRSGPRGFRALGIAAGTLLALAIAVGLLAILHP